jgi:uncharacterized protein (UPF0335 family)
MKFGLKSQVVMAKPFVEIEQNTLTMFQNVDTKLIQNMCSKRLEIHLNGLNMKTRRLKEIRIKNKQTEKEEDAILNLYGKIYQE